jgi:hypothetical protein
MKMLSEKFTGNELTNLERAARIIKVTDEYLAELGEDIEDITEYELAFLVADMMHACRIKKLDFNKVLTIVESHFQEEQEL